MPMGVKREIPAGYNKQHATYPLFTDMVSMKVLSEPSVDQRFSDDLRDHQGGAAVPIYLRLLIQVFPPAFHSQAAILLR